MSTPGGEGELGCGTIRFIRERKSGSWRQTESRARRERETHNTLQRGTQFFKKGSNDSRDDVGVPVCAHVDGEDAASCINMRRRASSAWFVIFNIFFLCGEERNVIFCLAKKGAKKLKQNARRTRGGGVDGCSTW